MKKDSANHPISPLRLLTIAANTITEVSRQKFFYILFVFAIVVLCCSLFFSEFSSTEQMKFTKDFGLAAMMFFGALIAIVGTAELLPLELENRTIYPILAKPVYRAEFLFGKYVGMISLLFITLFLMSLIFFGILLHTEHKLIADSLVSGTHQGSTAEETIRQLKAQVRDPALVKAIGLIFFKLVIVSALGLLIGTFATSVIFNVICNSLLYICGHLTGIARQEWMSSADLPLRGLLGIIVFFVPDLDVFNVADAVVTGQGVPMALVLQTIRYGLTYTMVVLLLAYFFFQNKEI